MKPLRLTALTVSERLWPLRPLDAREVATWNPELRARYYDAVKDARGAEAMVQLMDGVFDILGEG
jgi:hypothetical protein